MISVKKHDHATLPTLLREATIFFHIDTTFLTLVLTRNPVHTASATECHALVTTDRGSSEMSASEYASTSVPVFPP